MDPDEALQDMKKLSFRLERADYEDLTEQLDAGSRLAELVQSLDDWIMKGGFLPAAWKKASQGR